jgi:hypothetical protein
MYMHIRRTAENKRERVTSPRGLQTQQQQARGRVKIHSFIFIAVCTLLRELQFIRDLLWFFCSLAKKYAAHQTKYACSKKCNFIQK